MDGLGDLVLTVAQSFDTILRSLDDMQAKSEVSFNLKGKLGQNRKQWLEISFYFRELVEHSLNVAAEGLDTADDFVFRLYPFLFDEGTPKQRRKAEVGVFLGILDQRTKSAQDTSQGFADLKKQTGRIADEFKNTLIQAGFSIPSLKKRIQQLEGEIASLNNSLRHLDAQIDSLKDKRTGAKAAAGAAGVMGFVMPIAFFGAAAAAVKASNLSDKIDNLKYQRSSTSNDVTTKEHERNALQQDARAIPTLIENAKTCTPGMEKIIVVIGGCATAWATIRAESQAIQENLNYVQGTEVEKMFQRRVVNTGKKCLQLRNSLLAYITRIDQHPDVDRIFRSFEWGKALPQQGGFLLNAVAELKAATEETKKMEAKEARAMKVARSMDWARSRSSNSRRDNPNQREGRTEGPSRGLSRSSTVRATPAASREPTPQYAEPIQRAQTVYRPPGTTRPSTVYGATMTSSNTRALPSDANLYSRSNPPQNFVNGMPPGLYSGWSGGRSGTSVQASGSQYLPYAYATTSREPRTVPPQEQGPNAWVRYHNASSSDYGRGYRG